MSAPFFGVWFFWGVFVLLTDSLAYSTKSTATSKTVKSKKAKTEAFIDLEEMPVGEV